MPHTSPQNRPNYNVSFSAMGGGSPSAGVKAQTGMGEKKKWIKTDIDCYLVNCLVLTGNLNLTLNSSV